MLARHVTYEKECLLCKVVSGTAFGAFGAFNIWRASSVWSYMGIRDKAFNVVAISFVFMLSAMSYNYAYRIHMGQKMELIELRPSYTARFSESFRFMRMSPEEKQEYLEEQIKIEEEKAEVQRYLREQKA